MISVIFTETTEDTDTSVEQYFYTQCQHFIIVYLTISLLCIILQTEMLLYNNFNYYAEEIDIYPVSVFLKKME